MQADDYLPLRRSLVRHLRGQGICDEAVLAAMEEIPRHRFLDASLSCDAYRDRALPIGGEQTCSQPYIVALMSGMAMDAEIEVRKVLEIGTGCGYQSAVLSHLVERVFTVERIASLQQGARELLSQLGCNNIDYLVGDGFDGWEDHQPYDAILVTAAPAEIPPKLLAQLVPGGRLVIPVGDQRQSLRIVTRTASGFDELEREAVRFVPMLRGQIGKDHRLCR